jgi:hypothetical protein
MPMLSPTQYAQYQREGVVFPLRVLDAEKAGILAGHCDVLQSRMGHWVASPQISKSNLVSCAMADVIRNETLLDAVESIIGPDILCWAATLFAKPVIPVATSAGTKTGLTGVFRLKNRLSLPGWR